MTNQQEQLPNDPWQRRSEGMRCRTCISFCRKQGPVGRCRRHAPTNRGFPVVFESDWCGDHRLDEDSLKPGQETATA